MHVNTIFHRVLKGTEASAVFAELHWPTRYGVLETLYAIAAQAIIEPDGHADRARQEITALTGSPFLGELAHRSICRIAARMD